MEIGQKHRTRIEEIINTTGCSKNFECYKSGFANLSKAKDVGLETYVECLLPQGHSCEFSFPFGDKNLCKCPLRVYVTKNLQK